MSSKTEKKSKNKDRSSSKKKKSSSKSKKDPATTTTTADAPANKLTEFEFGELFVKHCSNQRNGLTKSEFMALITELETKKSDSSSFLTPQSKFDAGMLFASYDTNGFIDKASFLQILGRLKRQQQENADRQQQTATYPSSPFVPPYVKFAAAHANLENQQYQRDQPFTASNVHFPSGDAHGNQERGATQYAHTPYHRTTDPFKAQNDTFNAQNDPFNAQNDARATRADSSSRGQFPTPRYHPPPPMSRSAGNNIDDTESPHAVAIKRDYLQFKTEIDSLLTPRKDAETVTLQRIRAQQDQIYQDMKKREADIDKYCKDMIARLRKHTEQKLNKLEQAKEPHAFALEKIYNFERLAYSNHPQGALDNVHEPYYKAKVTGVVSLDEEGVGTLASMSGLRFTSNIPVPHAIPASSALRTNSLIEFIRAFPELKQKAEQLIVSSNNLCGTQASWTDNEETTRRIVETVNEEPFPEELEALKRKCSEYEQLKQTVEEKDKVIWMMVQEKEALGREREQFERDRQDVLAQVQSVAEGSKEEVANWVGLFDRMTADFSRQIATLQEECRVLQEANEEMANAKSG